MNRLFRIILGAALLLLLIIFGIAGKYIDWLWFQTAGSTAVFWVGLITGPVAKITLIVFIFGFFLFNLLIAIRAFSRVYVVNVLMPEFSKGTVLGSGIIVAGLLAIVLGSGLSLDWTVIQQYLHRITVGTSDPIFNLDLGYYLFSYPFYQQLYSLLLTVTFLALVGAALIYFLAKALWVQGSSLELSVSAKVHLTLLAILFLGVKIWGYSLGKYSLLFQETSRFTGINYTAEHARVFALTILTWIVIGIIGLLIYGLFRRGTKLFLGSVILWLAASLILNVIYPGLIQTFKVGPNEFELEAPYLKHHIDFTRRAYALDKIKQVAFHPAAGKKRLSPAHPSLADLRLWHYEPLLNTYNQLQSIRPYYQFNDIDIDRYPSTNGKRQLMISARELVTGRLPEQARTWINLHLTYTHGYGFAANQVNQFSDQGQPIFIAKDLPPKTAPEFPGLKVANPGIYYGEATNDYVIVNSKNEEFDYPQGDRNITTTYQADSGIRLNSFFVKLLLAIKYREPNFLLSPQLTPESSILIYRNIRLRAQMLAPFLRFDNDPYLVVSGGKLYWIIDAYTVSSSYPYSRPFRTGLNYVRNSVKAVVDAYTGAVNFYIVDPSDPLIRVWEKVFPGLLKSDAELDPDIKNHFRYPEDLLTIQRDLLLQYHMTDPRTFYEKEDYWDVPESSRGRLFEPYYMMLTLPGNDQAEFVLMQPFTPRNKQNLIAWLIARCDGPNYGELILYTLPKDQNIYGPEQIDSRINQDETISQLITLWNQQQSNVIWGNLLIIPIDGNILYVRPLYLESERSKQAELKKVVMVYEDQVLIGDTVAEALSGFTAGISAAERRPDETAASETDRKIRIINELLQISREEQELNKRKLQL
ncbi:MAG: UPF0182 family protein, partial [Firmicutes bacterium]|nr:UPF0182 family protein [Bacillota bacterium]